MHKSRNSEQTLLKILLPPSADATPMKEIEIALLQLKLPRKQLNVDDIMGKSSSKYSSLKQIPSYLIFVPHDKGFTVNPQKT